VLVQIDQMHRQLDLDSLWQKATTAFGRLTCTVDSTAITAAVLSSAYVDRHF
jgi:hypothetical protein